MPSLRRLLPLFAALALGACVRAQSAPLEPAVARAPVPADSVIVYPTPADAPPKHDSVAWVEVRGDWLIGGDRVVEALRAEAGRLGANGVVLRELAEPAMLTRVGDFALGGGVAEHRARAVAIWAPRANASAPTTAPLD